MHSIHSISAIGATEESLQLLSRMEAHRVRCIVGSARRITFESTADLCERLGLSTVRVFLCKAVERRVAQVTAQEQGYPGRSILSRLTDPALQPQRLNTKPSRPRLTPSIPRADFRKRCVDGLPICAHCGQSFRKWGGFKGHLNACPVLQSNLASEQSEPQPIPGEQQQPETTPTSLARDSVPVSMEGSNALAFEPVAILPSVSTAGSLPFNQQAEKLAACRLDWISFAEKEGQRLSQYCVVCGQWCAQSSGMKSHIRRSRPEIWSHNDALMNALKAEPRVKYKGRCRACNFNQAARKQERFALQSALRTTRHSSCCRSFVLELRPLIRLPCLRCSLRL